MVHNKVSTVTDNAYGDSYNNDKEVNGNYIKPSHWCPNGSFNTDIYGSKTPKYKMFGI